VLTKLQELVASFMLGYGREGSESPSHLLFKTWIGVPMKPPFVRFAKDESGSTVIEYGLIATLIGVAIIAGATALGALFDGLGGF
jgi:Flp pilus assembly pilin Flp